MDCLATFDHGLFSSELQDASLLPESLKQANKEQNQGITAFDVLSDNRTFKKERRTNTKRKRSEREQKKTCEKQPKKHIRQDNQVPEKLENYLKKKNPQTPVNIETLCPSAPMYIEDIIIRDTNMSKIETPVSSFPGSQPANSYHGHDAYSNSLHFQLSPFSSRESPTNNLSRKESAKYGTLKNAKESPYVKTPCYGNSKTNRSNSTSPKEKITVIYDDNEVRDYLYVFGSRSQNKKQDYTVVAKKKSFQSTNCANFFLLKNLMDPKYIPETAEERSLCIQVLEEVLNP
ncbi:Mde2 protein [Schizosaccharomyces cryophilus OY26]|uniref:Mde2 protein n=1 Tax=Schizosaccharomyces cryophilus (strain OY26 / ATCC MYA-4695 / CBS 11777 / NBRC 106824 / NRRL Y48691) TaxID=653667 RepID=S9W548_SCHCR|nr:Mde2 protein [Schizosaccharomyces cryophilus OY26]EPY53669.1 Mde2 protein [Schizosaccharomyces cryophilus OY26]